VYSERKNIISKTFILNEKQKNIEFTGVWIPKEIWEMQDLSITEKCMLSLIHSFNVKGNEFNATNRWLASFFGLNQKYVSEILNTLSRKNRIGIQIFRDTLSRNIRKRVCSFIWTGIQKKPEVYNKENNKEEITKFITNPDFAPIVTEWLEYKKSKGQTYKNLQSVKKLLNQLVEFSGGDARTAQKIINASIANNYAGIFPIDNKSKNGKLQSGQILQDENYVQKVNF